MSFDGFLRIKEGQKDKRNKESLCDVHQKDFNNEYKVTWINL